MRMTAGSRTIQTVRSWNNQKTANFTKPSRMASKRASFWLRRMRMNRYAPNLRPQSTMRVLREKMPPGPCRSTGSNYNGLDRSAL